MNILSAINNVEHISKCETFNLICGFGHELMNFTHALFGKFHHELVFLHQNIHLQKV